MSNYAHPEVLVSTQWVTDHLNDSNVRLIEVDTKTVRYESGHLPGAICWTIYQDLLQPDNKMLDATSLETLLSQSGISNNMTVVVYGDSWNSQACMAFWVLRAYGHYNLYVMNGGRKKWLAEGRQTTTAKPTPTPTEYRMTTPDWSNRARRDFVLESIGKPDRVLVDVRNSKEFRGEFFWPAEPPQEGERAGHIPGAVHIPFEMAMNDDGMFKSVEELRVVYEGKGVTADKEICTYCTVGGRSCHTWFVLKYLLGYRNVQEYVDSWFEWGRLPDVPVEK